LYVFFFFVFFLRKNTQSAPATMVIHVKRLPLPLEGKPHQITTSFSLGLFVLVFDLIALLCELRICDKDRNPL
jgi:hypothetical protein